MLSVIATELKRNFGANLSTDKVEKFMKFAQQFSRLGKRSVLKLLSTSYQMYRVTIRPCGPPLVRLNFIAGLLSALIFVSFEFGCSKGDLL